MPYKDKEFQKEYDRQRHHVSTDPTMRKWNRDHSKIRRLEIKIKVLSHYGLNHTLHCCWPGCDVVDIDILCLDHVKDNGSEQRKTLPGSTLYEYLVRYDFPEGYQTLCANHNLKKEILRRRLV